MWLKSLILLLWLSSHKLVNGIILNHYGTCMSPHNDTGLCVHLSDCKYLLDMLNRETLQLTDREYLRQSQCGYDNTQTEIARRTLVCCPDKYCKDSDVDPHRLQTGNILPEAGVCGFVPSNRVIGGTRTKVHEFPWMALIQYKKAPNKYEFICGGSLINNRYVLTAAHCVSKVPTTWELTVVRLGEWDIESDPDCEVNMVGRKSCANPHLDVGVESFVAHAEYDADSLNHFNDIALLRLKDPVNYTNYIKPICLPQSKALDRSYKGIPLDVAGWGSTENSKSSRYKLTTTIYEYDLQECRTRYMTQNVSVKETLQLCAGGKVGVDTCGGDSGGPLMINERLGVRDITFAIGIVAQGTTPCGLQGWPGIYTRVASYIPWIKEHLRP